MWWSVNSFSMPVNPILILSSSLGLLACKSQHNKLDLVSRQCVFRGRLSHYFCFFFLNWCRYVCHQLYSRASIDCAVLALKLHSVICCYTIYLQPRTNINAKRIIFLLRIMIAYVILRILLIFFPILVAILVVVLKFLKLSYIMIIPV